MKKSKSLKKVIQNLLVILFCVFALTSCKPTMEVTVYTSDIEKSVGSEEVITVPVKLLIPIQSADECQANAQKIYDIVNPYALNLKFKKCIDLKMELHDLAEFEMDTQIIDVDIHSKYKGLMALSIRGNLFNFEDSTNVGMILSPFVDQIVDDVRSKFYQTVKGIDIKINVVNDKRTSNHIIIGSVYLDSVPVPVGMKYELTPRKEVSFEISNVSQSSMFLNKSGDLFYYSTNPELLSSFDEFKR